MESIALLVLVYIIGRYVTKNLDKSAHEMPDNYDEKRTWVRMEKNGKSYWVVKKTEYIDTNL